jgi:hypothetical protein
MILCHSSVFLGLGFRPQPKFDPNGLQTFIDLSPSGERHGKRFINDDSEIYIKNLDEFLNVCK